MNMHFTKKRILVYMYWRGMGPIKFLWKTVINPILRVYLEIGSVKRLPQKHTLNQIFSLKKNSKNILRVVYSFIVAMDFQQLDSFFGSAGPDDEQRSWKSVIILHPSFLRPWSWFQKWRQWGCKIHDLQVDVILSGSKTDKLWDLKKEVEFLLEIKRWVLSSGLYQSLLAHHSQK